MARSVRAEQGISKGIERDLESVRLGEERFFRQLPFNGATERTRQPVPIEAIREEIIVRPGLDGLRCDLFALVRAHDEDGRGEGGPEHLYQPPDARGIGQTQIQQHRTHTARRQSFKTVGEFPDPVNVVEIVLRPAERLPDHLRVEGAPADVQDTMPSGPHLQSDHQPYLIMSAREVTVQCGTSATAPTGLWSSGCQFGVGVTPRYRARQCARLHVDGFLPDWVQRERT